MTKELWGVFQLVYVIGFVVSAVSWIKRTSPSQVLLGTPTLTTVTVGDRAIDIRWFLIALYTTFWPIGVALGVASDLASLTYGEKKLLDGYKTFLESRGGSLDFAPPADPVAQSVTRIREVLAEELDRAPENGAALEMALLERAYTVVLNATSLSPRGVKKLLDALFARQVRFHKSWVASRATKTSALYLRSLHDLDRKFSLISFAAEVDQAAKGLADRSKEMKTVDNVIAKALPQGDKACALLAAFLHDRAFRLDMMTYLTIPKDTYCSGIVAIMEHIWEEIEPLRAENETKGDDLS